jgi:hypothetical protein
MDSARSQIDARPGRAGQRPKWYLLYYLLAAFDIVTVLACLTLNHLVLQNYVNSVGKSREWANREDQYAHLAELARAVNAPGNDVFDSRDVDAESTRRPGPKSRATSARAKRSRCWRLSTIFRRRCKTWSPRRS